MVRPPQIKILAEKKIVGKHLTMSFADNRPHFAVMGEKYKHEDPDSEEEIWIPVKLKT